MLQWLIVLKTYLKYTIHKALVHFGKHGKWLLRLKGYLKWWKTSHQIVRSGLQAKYQEYQDIKISRTPTIKSSDLTFLKTNINFWVSTLFFSNLDVPSDRGRIAYFLCRYFFVVVASLKFLCLFFLCFESFLWFFFKFELSWESQILDCHTWYLLYFQGNNVVLEGLNKHRNTWDFLIAGYNEHLMP